MPENPKAIDLLTSIDASLKVLVRMATANAPKPVADDADLDGKYGDPELRFNPRDWTGADFKGRHFSECPAELLEMAAETFDYFARQAEAKNELTDKGKPVAQYKRLDAARARGWAKRVREGKGRLAEPTPADANPHAWADAGGFEKSDDEVPF